MKIKTKILTLLALFTITITATTADTLANISNITPDRSGVHFVEGQQGFPYPSFNNFTENPNILGSREGDERKFLVGKDCPGGESGCPGQLFYNTPQTAIKDGDLVRFEIYFHNNGEDPYDNGSANSPNAKNVKIGIDLNDINDPNLADILRPRGFITADNNEYRSNTNNAATVLKDTNGNIIRTATDDMQLIMWEPDLELQPVVGSTFLTLENIINGRSIDDPNNPNPGFYDDLVTGPTSIQFSTPDGTNFTTHANVHSDGKKLWIEFDELPGCFRYSGFVQFDAIVKKKPEAPVCKSLSAAADIENPININGKRAFKLSTGPVTYSDGVVPDGAMYKWTTTDPNGKFFTRANPLGTYVEQGNSYSVPVSQSNFSNLYYVGEKEIKAEMTPSEYSSSACQKVIPLPDLPPPSEQICQNILVNHNSQINTSQVSKFQAKSVDTNGEIYDGKITYSVDEGYGIFYNEDPNNGTSQNNSTFQTEFDANEPIEVPDTGYFCQSIETLGASTFFNAGLIYIIPASAFTPSEKDISETEKNPNPIDPEEVFGGGTHVTQSAQTNIFNATKGPQSHNTVKVGDPIFGGVTQHQSTYSTPKDLTTILAANTITVDPGETVYFIATQPGENVVHVATNCTEEGGCNRSFSTVGAPTPTCADATLSVTETSGARQVVECLDKGIYNFKVTFYSDLAHENVIPSSQVTALWTSTDTTGIFYDPIDYTLAIAAGKEPEGSTGNYLGSSHVIYVGGGEVSGELYAIDSIPYNGKICKAQIGECDNPLTCEQLQVGIKKLPEATPVNNDLTTGTLYSIASEAKYNGEVSSPTSDYTSIQGVFFEKNSDPIMQMLIENLVKNGLTKNEADDIPGFNNSMPSVPDGKEIYFLTYTDANPGNALTVQASNRVEAACTMNFSLITKPSSECQNISVKIDETTNDEKLISVTGNLGDFNGSFLFESDSGEFYTTANPSDSGNPKTFTIAEAENRVRLKNAGEDPAIQITAVGPLAGNSCKYTSRPEKLICKDLKIVEPSGAWNERDMDGNDQDFEIEVRTDPSGYERNLTYHWDVSPSSGGDLKYTKTSRLTNTLEDVDLDKKVKVSVWVEDSNGDTIKECYDSVKLDINDREMPDIKKYIYDAKDRGWSKTINLAGRSATAWLDIRDRFVTYLAVFDPGSAKSVAIKENSFRNGSIKASNRQNGTFDYQSMAIAVEGDRRGDDYVIFRSKNFNEDRYNDYDLNNYQEIRSFDNFDEDLRFFEDHYACDGNDYSNGDVCISSDFDELEKDFSNGDPIYLSNTEEAEKIYIVYQVENNTNITDEYCKTTISAIEGCGEQFDNTIEYTAYEEEVFNEDDSDYEDRKRNFELDNDEDSARAIVICPYVLTREGGDVFFHSTLDTGIDLRQCYPVENTPGIVIKPTPETPQTHINTGAGEDDNGFVLEAPTHDICKLSNTSNNIEGYQNVLENFSSSICELQADVADQWTERNINSTLESNIKKIARFDSLIGNFSISHTDKLKVNNPSSGVFVIEGNLTIDNGSNDFMIGASKEIPAAQTYIIRNGDLTINSNISYQDQNVDVTKPQTIPSAAFIVVNGNINIKNSVDHIDGIVMAINSAGNNKGQITSSTNSAEYEHTLTINGSLIGNVYNLFANRRAIGDPLKDQGSVTIRYDQRVLLNTPPGLEELIDISQLRIAN